MSSEQGMNIRMISSCQQRTEPLHDATGQTIATIRRSYSHRSQAQSLATHRGATVNSGLSQSERVILLRRLAMTNAQQGNYSKAIDLLTTLLTHDPKSASDYNNRGLLHFQNGQPGQALRDYNQALQINPRLAKIYNNRANCYAALGKLLEAIADYETALDLNPTNIHALINLGITFRDLECYESAIENFDLALQVNRLLGCVQDGTQTRLQGHVYAERGRAYHLAGDWNCAVADYQQALSKLPSSISDIAHTSYRLRLQVNVWLNQLLPSQ